MPDSEPVPRHGPEHLRGGLQIGAPLRRRRHLAQRQEDLHGHAEDRVRIEPRAQDGMRRFVGAETLCLEAHFAGLLDERVGHPVRLDVGQQCTIGQQRDAMVERLGKQVEAQPVTEPSLLEDRLEEVRDAVGRHRDERRSLVGTGDAGQHVRLERRPPGRQAPEFDRAFDPEALPEPVRPPGEAVLVLLGPVGALKQSRTDRLYHAQPDRIEGRGGGVAPGRVVRCQLRRRHRGVVPHTSSYRPSTSRCDAPRQSAMASARRRRARSSISGSGSPATSTCAATGLSTRLPMRDSNRTVTPSTPSSSTIASQASHATAWYSLPTCPSGFLPHAASSDMERCGVINPPTRLPRPTCPSSPASADEPVNVRYAPSGGRSASFTCTSRRPRTRPASANAVRTVSSAMPCTRRFTSRYDTASGTSDAIAAAATVRRTSLPRREPMTLTSRPIGGRPCTAASARARSTAWTADSRGERGSDTTTKLVSFARGTPSARAPRSSSGSRSSLLGFRRISTW